MSNPHVRYDIIAGISSTDKLFYTINIEKTDEAVFLRYLVNGLFPRIVDQQRVHMWDNLNVHLGPRITRTRPVTPRCPARRTTRTRARSSSSSARSRSG